jgi:UDP-N-acetylglucosamine--dolichyl-phosphate N-acetylglucosaminephosphotransferase
MFVQNFFGAPLFFESVQAWFRDFLLVEFNELILAGVILFLSFGVTIFLTDKWIKAANKSSMVGKDMNKPDYPIVPRSGGLVVAVVICFSLLIYIFLKTFSLLGTPSLNVIEALAITATVLLAGFIGFIDDVLGWKDGLSQMQKVLLTIPIALPLVVINAGQSVIVLPILGNVDLGLLYPLLIIPIGIIGATNGYNLLAGYNGLEASMGLVIFGTFGFTSLLVGRLWIALIAFIVFASLLWFLVFNWYPAKTFQGNAFSYAVGAMVGTLAILGNMERIAVWLFIPYFFEILLYFKARAIDHMGDVASLCKTQLRWFTGVALRAHIYDMTHFCVVVPEKGENQGYERRHVVFLIIVECLFAVSGIVLLL